MPETLRKYAELARLSNIPTVLSNVCVGFAIGAATAAEPANWWSLLIITPAMMLLYIAGMALNDLVDVNIDRCERPTRPIPSGRIAASHAAIFAGACFALGLLLLGLFGAAALGFGAALVVCIVLYDVIHKRTPLAAVLMGICRGLVYLTAAACIAWPLQWSIAMPLALAMTVYISLVTLIARGEAPGDRPTGLAMRIAMALPLVALAPALWVVPNQWGLAVLAALLMLSWLIFTQRHLLARPPRVGNAVMGLLAGICLLDALYLTLLEHNALAAIAVACFAVTLAGHRRISGT